MDILTKYHFNDLKEDEKIIQIIHRHWFDIAQQFLIVFVIIMVLVAGFFLIPLLFASAAQKGFYSIAVFLGTTFALLVWIYAFLIWIDYYFDTWIITSERIVDIEQKGLFTRQISELKYAKIQDVTTEVEGIFQTVLNYGDVHIQTAAEEERFFFRQVPDPYGIKSLIMSLQKKQEEEKVEAIGEMLEKTQ